MSTVLLPPIQAVESTRPPGRTARIAHLTSVHTAFDVRIFHKECKTLAEAGYEVILIAPHDKAEVIQGVNIEPVSKEGSRRRRMSSTVWEVYRKAVHSHPDLVHFHDPELLPVGVLLKLRGARVIYDAHEHLANDILSKYWIRPSLRRIVSASAGTIERLATKAFDGVIGATPAIANCFPPHKTELVQNYPLAGEFVESTGVPYRQRRPVIVYAGSITEMKGAREMVQAMSHLPGNLPARLTLLGETEPSGLRAELEVMPGWDKVDYLGLRERSSLAQFLYSARVGLALFHPIPNYDDSQPNKLFEYMSAGLPVVASNFPAWRALIEKLDCGLVVDPLDTRAIAGAMQWILERPSEAEAMGKRGKEAVRSTYNWNSQAASLLSLYARVLG